MEGEGVVAAVLVETIGDAIAGGCVAKRHVVDSVAVLLSAADRREEGKEGWDFLRSGCESSLGVSEVGAEGKSSGGFEV